MSRKLEGVVLVIELFDFEKQLPDSGGLV